MSRLKIKRVESHKDWPGACQKDREVIKKDIAARNCTTMRSFGDRSDLSPKRLIKDKKEAESQNPEGILSIIEDKTKAARIPTPPPFGTGISCELLSPGLSINPYLCP